MASMLRVTWDSLSAILFPACVWGGPVQSPLAASKPSKSSGFRLHLEIFEPRMALAANPLIEPLTSEQPFELGELPYAEQELRNDGATLGSAVVNIAQQAEAPHQVEARNAAGLTVVVFSRDAGPEALDQEPVISAADDPDAHVIETDGEHAAIRYRETTDRGRIF